MIGIRTCYFLVSGKQQCRHGAPRRSQREDYKQLQLHIKV